MNFRIIDIHTHAWPQKVAEKARQQLESLFKVECVGIPTVDTLLAFMDRNKIDISCVCGVATKPEQVPSINNWLFGIRSSRLRVFCALHPFFKGWRDEIKRIKDNGDGIKFQPEFQGFYVDDEKMFNVYEEIEKKELPVLFHCGEELSGTMLVRSSPKRINRVIEKFPHLKVIAAHFGGFRLWGEVEEYLLGKNVYVDTAFFFKFLPQDKIIKLITTHPSDKILFGTDFPLIDQKEDINYLLQLEINPSLKEKIFYKNAFSLLKID